MKELVPIKLQSSCKLLGKLTKKYLIIVASKQKDTNKKKKLKHKKQQCKIDSNQIIPNRFIDIEGIDIVGILTYPEIYLCNVYNFFCSDQVIHLVLFYGLVKEIFHVLKINKKIDIIFFYCKIININ